MFGSRRSGESRGPVAVATQSEQGRSSVSDQETYQKWIPVIARSLAYLCVQVGELKEKGLTEKASFLEAAGVDRKDVAAMLGTTYGSISEMLSKAKRDKKGGKKKNAKRKER